MPLIDAFRLPALLTFALVAAVAGSSVRAAPGDIGPESPAANSAQAVLPTPTGAKRPIRITRSKACNGDCWIAIYKVPPNLLLQIDNVSCINKVADANPTKFFAIAPGFNFSVPLTAFIPASQLLVSGGFTTVIANVSGPYFFAPDEGVFMFSGGSGFTVTCTISGTLATVP